MSRPDAYPRERAGLAAVAIVVVVLALLVGAGWAGVYLTARGDLPRGTSVEGVDVGGQDRAAAAAGLARGLAGPLTAAITVTVGTKNRIVSPETIGISIDYDATLAAVPVQDSWRPEALWDHFTDGPDLDPVVRVDRTTFAQAMRRLDGLLGTPGHNGRVRFGSTGVQVVQPVAGSRIDPDQAASAIGAVLFDDPGPERTVELPLRTVQPSIDAADVRRAVERIANPALAGPVTLLLGTHLVRLQPTDFASALRLTPKNGSLALKVSGRALVRLLPANLQRGRSPVPASLTIENGAPVVVAAIDGVRWTPARVAQAFAKAVVRTRDRTERVRPIAVKARVGAGDVSRLGITDQLSSYTVQAPPRLASGLAAAASRINGTILRPGRSFSFLSTVGSSGSGLGWLASATYTAALGAGLPIEEHHGTPTHVTGLPNGFDAVVSSSDDLRFTAPADHGLLLTASADSSGRVTVAAWSTRVASVVVSTSPAYAVVPAPVVTSVSPRCRPRLGRVGYSVDVTRSVTDLTTGAVGAEESFTSTYRALSRIICGG